MQRNNGARLRGTILFVTILAAVTLSVAAYTATQADASQVGTYSHFTTNHNEGERTETEHPERTETEHPERTETALPAVTGTANPQTTGTPAAGLPGAGSHLFPETGKTVSGIFLTYWQGHGGLAQQGYPISEVMQEVSDTNGKSYTVQYFERAVFEYHPENKPPFDVLLSQLGTFQYRAKYPTGAPNQHVNNASGSQLFPETGKQVGGIFLAYWKSHGGLAQQGYPISEEFTEVSALNGQPYKVQYFERAVFELHPENAAPNNVLLSQLGTFRYRAKYGAPSGGNTGGTTTPVAQPSATPGAQNAASVSIVDFSFNPANVTVAVGAKVTWTNNDSTVHTSTSDTGKWDSGILQRGQSYSFTFTQPGTYNYICTVHPKMRGQIIVR